MMVLAWLVLAVARAEGWWLATTPVPTRLEALALAEDLGDVGQVSVVRSRDGDGGWGYVVVVEGFTGEAAAREAAARVAERVELPVAVHRPPGDDTGAAALLARVLEALGGEGGAIELREWVFDRMVADEGVEVLARHRLLHGDGERRLEIEVLDGPARSLTLVAGEGWARALVEGRLLEADPGRAAEVFAELGPEELLGPAWGLRGMLSGWDGRPLLLAPAGEEVAVALRDPPGEGLVELRVRPSDALPTAAVFVRAGSRVEVRVADWREVRPGRLLPRRLAVLRGEQVVERVEVIRLVAASPPVLDSGTDLR